MLRTHTLKYEGKSKLLELKLEGRYHLEEEK